MTTTSLHPAPASVPARAWERVRELIEDTPELPSPAVLASLVVPGAGSMLNGHLVKGAAILSGTVASVLVGTSVAAGAPVLAAAGVFTFWLVGLVDAYHGADD